MKEKSLTRVQLVIYQNGKTQTSPIFHQGQVKKFKS